MKNRDRLRETALIDTLTDVNACIQSGDYLCVVEVLEGEYRYIDRDRCITRAHDCGKCLQEWLNEEENNG